MAGVPLAASLATAAQLFGGVAHPRRSPHAKSPLTQRLPDRSVTTKREALSVPGAMMLSPNRTIAEPTPVSSSHSTMRMFAAPVPPMGRRTKAEADVSSTAKAVARAAAASSPAAIAPASAASIWAMIEAAISSADRRTSGVVAVCQSDQIAGASTTGRTRAR